VTDRSRWFVSTAWLAEHLGDPNVVIVDGSWHLAGRNARAEYDAGHIPGAVFFDIDAIADTANPLPHMLPSPEFFANAVGALGVDEKQKIVVYDSVGLSSAPRVWWTFKVMGARAVVILEGGLPQWTAERRPVSAERVARAPRTFGVERGSFQLVDARPEPRFRGAAPEPRSWVKTGRVPGSLNVPSGAIIEDGRLADDATLRAAFAAGGVDFARPIVTSCGSGVNAAALSLALDVLGVQRTALYDGSWTEWGARHALPIATG
jgi:thiosulfate/3-mercaptopyruvate sulfurtransferase